LDVWNQGSASFKIELIFCLESQAAGSEHRIKSRPLIFNTCR